MNLITVIIPMYNEEKNVKKCVDCLRNQTNQDFSVIFVDDGSIDSTVDKLDKFLTRGVNFNYEILKQKNQGAAAARENGIRSAKTDFIMILDCDDECSDNLVDQIYIKYEEYKNVDIILPFMKIQNEDKTWSNLILYTDEIILKPLDCVFHSLNGWNVHGCFAVKKSVIEKSYLDYALYNVNKENYVNNDEVVTRLNFLNSNEIVRCDAYYYYYYNPESTTKRVNDKKYLMINNAYILYKLFVDDFKLKSVVQEEFISVLWEVFRYMQKHGEELENLKDWKFVLSEKIKHIQYFKFISGVSVKKKLQLTLLKLAYLF